MSDGARWSGTAYSATTTTKTSQRTYTDSDGTQVTEVIRIMMTTVYFSGHLWGFLSDLMPIMETLKHSAVSGAICTFLWLVSSIGFCAILRGHF